MNLPCRLWRDRGDEEVTESMAYHALAGEKKLCSREGSDDRRKKNLPPPTRCLFAVLKALLNADTDLPLAIRESLLVTAFADDSLLGKERFTKAVVGVVVAGTYSITEKSHLSKVTTVDAWYREGGLSGDFQHVVGVLEVDTLLLHEQSLHLIAVFVDTRRQQTSECLLWDTNLLVLLDIGDDASPLVALLELQCSLSKRELQHRSISNQKNNQQTIAMRSPAPNSGLGCGFPQHLATKRALGGETTCSERKTGLGSTSRVAVFFLGMMKTKNNDDVETCVPQIYARQNWRERGSLTKLPLL